MRTLIILRHAKSSWATPGMDDFDRILNDRGNQDAVKIGHWLSQQALSPDEVICSPAVRTRLTYEHIKKTLNIAPAESFPENLYLAPSDTLREALSHLDTGVQTAMVIAHNPGLHDLALRLLQKDERSHAGLMRVSFPTTGCAIIKLPIDDWQDIGWNTGSLSSFMVPKSLVTAKA